MAKLKLPFELEKPSNNTYVTQASQIGRNGKPLDETVPDSDNTTSSELEIADARDNVILRLLSGHIKVKNFDTKVIGIIFDVSLEYAVAGTPHTYMNLSTALGHNCKNIPSYLRNGHLIVKFLNSTNKYELWSLASSSWTINTSSWQRLNVNDANDLTYSGDKSVKEALDEMPSEDDDDKYDLSFADDSGHCVIASLNGHIITQKFNSALVPFTTDSGAGELEFADADGNVVLRLTDGHIKTKNFNSARINQDTPYKGKKCSILGDSISTFGTPDSRNQNGIYCYSYYPTETCRYSELGNVTEGGRTYQSIQFNVKDTWWMKVISELGMSLGINESWRGTYVSGTNNSFNLQTRINHLGLNGTPDVILVYGGTNDAGNNVSIGTFNTENPANYTDSQIANLPVSTFADGYRTMLIRLMKTYPMAEIIVILPTFTTSYYTITNLDNYAELVKEACDFFGIKWIDIRVTGINVFNKNSYLVDGIHPNVQGMKLIADKIIRNILYT